MTRRTRGNRFAVETTLSDGIRKPYFTVWDTESGTVKATYETATAAYAYADELARKAGAK